MIKPSETFIKHLKSVNGALSVCESIAITNIAHEAPQTGWAVEFGSFLGKSAMSALVSLKTTFFLLVDPIFEDPKIIQEVSDNLSFIETKTVVKYSPLYSTDLLPKFAPYSFVFVDSGSHGGGLPMQEAKLLEDNMLQGGIIAFHDIFCQFIEVTEAYNYLLSTGKYEEIKPNWDEIVKYVDENNLEEGNTSWHHTELKNPMFVGALKRK